MIRKYLKTIGWTNLLTTKALKKVGVPTKIVTLNSAQALAMVFTSVGSAIATMGQPSTKFNKVVTVRPKEWNKGSSASITFSRLTFKIQEVCSIFPIKL